MRSQSAGKLGSACQTIRTGRLTTASSATFTSRSQLDPGKTTTQACIFLLQSSRMDAEAREERGDGLLVLLEFFLRCPRHEPIAQTRSYKHLNRCAALAQSQEFDLRAGDVGRIGDPRVFDNLFDVVDLDPRLVRLAAHVLGHLRLELRLVVAPRQFGGCLACVLW